MEQTGGLSGQCLTQQLQWVKEPQSTVWEMELSKVIALLSRNCSQVLAIVLEWQNLKLVSSREELELLDKTERQQHFNWIADAVTGVSGSGPAYMYLILEAMADEGVRQGLDRQTSYHLAAQTMVGAGRMVINTGSHPGVLKVNYSHFSLLSVIMTTYRMRWPHLEAALRRPSEHWRWVAWEELWCLLYLQRQTGAVTWIKARSNQEKGGWQPG